MSLIDEIKVKSLSDAQEILKSAGSEDIFEKAHKDGDLHPNGKWVWVSSAAGGKGDWRTLNGRTHQKHTAAQGGSGSSGGQGTSGGKLSAAELKKKGGTKKVDDTTIDQAEYDKAYKTATSATETEAHLKSSLAKIEANIKEIKDALADASDATAGKLQKMFTASVSKKKAIEDALKAKKGGNDIYRVKKTETYSHVINGVSVNVSKNKDGSYTLEANGKKVKSDDPSFFKDKLTPRVKKALAKEVGIDVKNPAKQFDIKQIGDFISSIKTTHGDVSFIPKNGTIYLGKRRDYIGDCDEEEKTIELRQDALSNAKRDREAIKEISSALKEKFGFVSKITYEDNPRHGLKKAYMKIVLKPSE